jgi:ParB/RepB/Spo0J family partition protein
MQIGKMPTLRWVKVDDVHIPEGRLNSYFEDREDFEASVKAEGVINPIYVIEDKDGTLWLADGKNRLETAKKYGKPLIQAYVSHGSVEDALLFSAKLNVHRGRVNIGELAEFVKRLKGKGLKVEEIADSLRLSKGYISQLLTIAENPEIVEKLKKGIISQMEAYKSSKSLVTKQVSEETIHEKPSEIPTVGQKPLTDEDLGLTSRSSVIEHFQHKEAEKTQKMETVSGEKSRKTEYMICDYCGKILPRLDVRWIKVHSDEYDKVLLAIRELAERETQNESSQPRGEEHGEERGSS